MVKKFKFYEDYFKCPICFDILIDPVIDKCGHTFCKKCIKNHLKNNLLCPFSKLEIGKNDLYRNLILKNILDENNFKCEFCKKRILYKKLKNHKKICVDNKKKKRINI